MILPKTKRIAHWLKVTQHSSTTLHYGVVLAWEFHHIVIDTHTQRRLPHFVNGLGNCFVGCDLTKNEVVFLSFFFIWWLRLDGWVDRTGMCVCCFVEQRRKRLATTTADLVFSPYIGKAQNISVSPTSSCHVMACADDNVSDRRVQRQTTKREQQFLPVLGPFL